MRQMQDEFSRFFGRPTSERDWPARSWTQMGEWAPAIDVFQRGDDFVVRADVPGMSRDDVSVEVGDDSLTIRGERKYEHDEEGEGIFRSERSYGSFVRVVPLPEGAIADTAKASFKNGVLEIVLQAPPSEVRRGRRLEIKEEKQETADTKKNG
jgi:HSP20 family protein